MDSLLKDIRFAIRSLLKRPGFSAIAIITLALGIGANSAMFTTVNAVLLRPLPYPESERIVLLEGVNPAMVITEGAISVPDLADWQSQTTSFEQIAGFISGGSLLTSGEETERVRGASVTSDFFPLFRTLKIPLIQGRVFTDHDTEQTTKVVVVNETMARRLWPGESPVGRHISIWRDEPFPRQIVGIVGDAKRALDTEAGQQMYVPYAQDSGWGSMSLVIRTSGEPAGMVAAVRNEIRTLEKGIPVYNVKTMNEALATSVGPRRTPMLLLSAFAAVALLLAMIGIYGVTAYYVTERTQEIGIRMALGAQMKDVMKLVLKGGMTLALVGIGVGLAGAFLLTRLMTSLLFGVKPTDGITFVAVSLCLLVTALLACYLPARRATKVDPLVALRYE